MFTILTRNELKSQYADINFQENNEYEQNRSE